MAWFGQSRRHSLARQGIKTAQKIPQTVKRLNVKRYMGKWYQISAFPQWFQRNCRDAIAEYEQKKGHISVKNSCIDKKTGELRVAYAKAYPVSSGKLEVDFVGGRIVTGDYWVLYTDYDTALVGSPDRKSLWILSRTKKISKAKDDKLRAIAKAQGYDIAMLK